MMIITCTRYCIYKYCLFLIFKVLEFRIDFSWWFIYMKVCTFFFTGNKKQLIVARWQCKRTEKVSQIIRIIHKLCSKWSEHYMENWFCMMRIILKAFRFHNMKKLTVILFLFAHIEKVFCFGNVSEPIHTKIVGFILCF